MADVLRGSYCGGEFSVYQLEAVGVGACGSRCDGIARLEDVAECGAEVSYDFAAVEVSDVLATCRVVDLRGLLGVVFFGVGNFGYARVGARRTDCINGLAEVGYGEVVRGDVGEVGLGFTFCRSFGLERGAESPHLVNQCTGLYVERNDTRLRVSVDELRAESVGQAAYLFAVECKVVVLIDVIHRGGGSRSYAELDLLTSTLSYGQSVVDTTDGQGLERQTAELVTIDEVRNVNEALDEVAEQGNHTLFDGVELLVDFFLVVEVSRRLFGVAALFGVVRILAGDEAELRFQVVDIVESGLKVALVGLAGDGGDFVYDVSLPVLESLELVVNIFGRGVSLVGEECVELVVNFFDSRLVVFDVGRGEFAPLVLNSLNAVNESGELGVLAQVEVSAFEGFDAALEARQVALHGAQVAEGGAEARFQIVDALQFVLEILYAASEVGHFAAESGYEGSAGLAVESGLKRFVVSCDFFVDGGGVSLGVDEQLQFLLGCFDLAGYAFGRGGRVELAFEAFDFPFDSADLLVELCGGYGAFGDFLSLVDEAFQTGGFSL